VRLTLLAALCSGRASEITDAPVDLLIAARDGIGKRFTYGAFGAPRASPISEATSWPW
jgi:hypothetical protein